MTTSVGKGTGMHLDASRLRFGRRIVRGPIEKLGDSVAEIRRLLRTDMTIEAIAETFCVTKPTLRSFIKRRNLCNLKDRRNFISLQKSMLRIDKS